MDPGLKVEDATYRPNLTVGAPGGEYDTDNLVTIGFNRWSIRPAIAASKVLGRWTIAGSAAIAFFTDNTNLRSSGQTREQAPLGSLQFHAVYHIKSRKGMWVSFDATNYQGGQKTVDGKNIDDELNNYHYGGTFSLPLNRPTPSSFTSAEASTPAVVPFTILSAWPGNIAGAEKFDYYQAQPRRSDSYKARPLISNVIVGGKLPQPTSDIQESTL
jgi:hypothetical protein